MPPKELASANHDVCYENEKRIRCNSKRTAMKSSSCAVDRKHHRYIWIALLLLWHPRIPMVTASTKNHQRQPMELENPLSMTRGRKGRNHYEIRSRRRRMKEDKDILHTKKTFQNQKEEKQDKEDKPEKEKEDKPNKHKTDFPTVTPSIRPTTSPQPSNRPSFSPSDKPSKIPTSPPTDEPTAMPSSRPTYTPGSPTPLPTQWKSNWHGDFTVKMSIFTFSDGDFVPPALQKDTLEVSPKNGNRNLQTEKLKQEKNGIEKKSTWSRINTAFHNYRENRFLDAASIASLIDKENGRPEETETGVKSSNVPPTESNKNTGRKLKITAGDILDGKEPELIHDVLTTFIETLCNETEFKILTEKSSNLRRRGLKKQDEDNTQDGDIDNEEGEFVPDQEVEDQKEDKEEENVLVDFCAGDDKTVDRFKDYSKKDTVLHAYLESFDSYFPAFELEDRDTYVNDVGGSLHWVEWEVRYDVIQVDRFTLSDIREDEMEKRNVTDIDVDILTELGVDSIKRGVQKKLSVASTRGAMDEVLAEKNDLILASSPIGSEALRFPKALSEWLTENQEDDVDEFDPNSIEQEVEPEVNPLLSPLQISGIVMLSLLVIFTTSIVRHAKKNEENKNSETWNRDVFTYEGVDFMLDAGRRNASLEQQQGNGQLPGSPAKVQVLVKPKNVRPSSNHEDRMTFMSMDDVAITPSFRRS